MKRILAIIIASVWTVCSFAQLNTNRLIEIGRSALYYEDYVLAIQYFNQAINAKPYLYEPWFYRAVAKFYLDDYSGSESDCTLAISHNPYVVNMYELRALSRIHLEQFDEAVADYNRAMKYEPDNQGLWYNRMLCKVQKKDYDAALADLDTMLTRWSTYAKGYAVQGEVYLMKGDTVKAIKALDHSIRLDAYDGNAWQARAAISLHRGKWKVAEGYLDKTIHLLPKDAGNYINRALCRVNQNNLRGALQDYDLSLDLDPKNFLAHYNRGLLRANVGDDNRAIKDFDFVLSLEPDNLMALFNRALLLDKTGNLRGAIRDYSKVIASFPNFWTGLHYRSACYRRLGMSRQAELDEYRIFKAQLYKQLYGKQPRLNRRQLRKRSELNLDKYNQLVVADDDSSQPAYKSDYRGQVQNRKVDMSYLPMYELSLTPYHNEVKNYIAYDKFVDAYNQQASTGCHIYINSATPTLDESQSKAYFHRIDSLTSAIAKTSTTVQATRLLLLRAVAYTAIQNFESAHEDLTTCIQSDSTTALAFWQRAVCQQKQNKYQASNGTDVTIKTANVVSDLVWAIQLDPQNAYLYYNRGCVYAARKDYQHAIDDFTRAIQLDHGIAEGWYNRGIARIQSGHKAEGVADLSKAGELGLYTAYSIIKKNSK